MPSKGGNALGFLMYVLGGVLLVGILATTSDEKWTWQGPAVLVYVLNGVIVGLRVRNANRQA